MKTPAINLVSRAVFALILLASAACSCTSMFAAVTTTGCSVTNPKAGIYTASTTDGNKTTRSYLVEIPTNYVHTSSYSLVFVFHGEGGNSAQAQSWGLQNATGASTSAIFVFPQGIQYENYGVGWDDAIGSYDFIFFDNMVSNLGKQYCIDSSQLFVSGFSWGGDFVTALTCNRGSVIRAAAANSTTDEYSDNTNFLTYGDLPCPTARHTAVRFEHAIGGDSAYPAPDFATTNNLFQYTNSCTTASTPVSSLYSGESCVQYIGCEVKYVECPFLASLGHSLPPDWAQNVWNFFGQFPSTTN